MDSNAQPQNKMDDAENADSAGTQEQLTSAIKCIKDSVAHLSVESQVLTVMTSVVGDILRSINNEVVAMTVASAMSEVASVTSRIFNVTPEEIIQNAQTLSANLEAFTHGAGDQVRH